MSLQDFTQEKNNAGKIRVSTWRLGEKRFKENTRCQEILQDKNEINYSQGGEINKTILLQDVPTSNQAFVQGENPENSAYPTQFSTVDQGAISLNWTNECNKWMTPQKKIQFQWILVRQSKTNQHSLPLNRSILSSWTYRKYS